MMLLLLMKVSREEMNNFNPIGAIWEFFFHFRHGMMQIKLFECKNLSLAGPFLLQNPLFYSTQSFSFRTPALYEVEEATF